METAESLDLQKNILGELRGIRKALDEMNSRSIPVAPSLSASAINAIKDSRKKVTPEDHRRERHEV